MQDSGHMAPQEKFAMERFRSTQDSLAVTLHQPWKVS